LAVKGHCSSCRRNPVLSNTPVTYFNTRSQNGWILGNVAIGLAHPLNALYNSLSLSPPSIQAASIDLWSNLKILDLKYLKANSTANNTGWFGASAQSNVTYSSLLGIPLRGIASTGTTKFTIESAYFTLGCLNSTVGPCHVLRTGVYIASSPPLGHDHSYIFTPTHIHSTSTACPGRDRPAVEFTSLLQSTQMQTEIRYSEKDRLSSSDLSLKTVYTMASVPI
jgi:hypothetical protein